MISGVKLSVVVPQAIGIYLYNRIGDSAGEFLVVVLWGFYRHSMFLNCSYFSVSVSGMGACLPGSVRIGVNFVSIHLFAFIFIHFSSCMRFFYSQSRIHMALTILSTYICGFTANSRVCLWFFFLEEDRLLLGEF